MADRFSLTSPSSDAVSDSSSPSRKKAPLLSTCHKSDPHDQTVALSSPLPSSNAVSWRCTCFGTGRAAPALDGLHSKTSRWIPVRSNLGSILYQLSCSGDRQYADQPGRSEVPRRSVTDLPCDCTQVCHDMQFALPTRCRAYPDEPPEPSAASGRDRLGLSRRSVKPVAPVVCDGLPQLPRVVERRQPPGDEIRASLHP